MAMGAMEKLFGAASKAIQTQMAWSCKYVRGGVKKTIQAYTNNPVANMFDATSVQSDSDTVEWYVRQEDLRRRGFGKPEEFDQIHSRGEVWEVTRLNGGRCYRDADPDFAVFARRVQER